MSKKEFKRIKEILVYQNKWIELFDDKVLMPNGLEGSYVRLKYHDNPLGAIIIPKLPDGRFLLLKVYRYAIDKELFEFPRGSGANEESILEVGVRELFEETGLHSSNVKLIGYLYPDSAIMMTKVGVVLAELKKEDEKKITVNSDEAINNSIFVTYDEIWSLVSKGEITDGFTLGALSHYQAENLNK